MTHWKHIFARPRQGLGKEVLRHLPWLLLSAVLLALAFPKPGWGWLAHIALVPAVVVTLRSQSPRILTASMYLVFALWWVWMLRWLMPVTGGGAVGLGMFMAVYWTAALLVVRHLHKAYRSAMVITLPLVWVTFELWRGWLPQGGFGWFCLGHSQAPWQAGDSPGMMIQIADIFGQPGVSFLVAMTNGLIVDFLTRPLFRRPRPGASGQARPMHQRVSKTLAVATLLWLGCMLGATGYGLFRFKEEKSLQQRRPVTAAVIQTAVPQSNKQASHAQRTGQGEEASETVDTQQQQQEEDDWQAMLSMTRQAAAMHPKPALIVWPETMIPRPVNPMAVRLFQDYDDPDRPAFSQQIRSWPRYHEQISFLARDLNTNLMVGASSMLFAVGQPGYDSANSVFLYDWRGMQSELRYDKMHRVPFGEYMPWVESAGWLKHLFLTYISPYKFDYSLTPGDRPVIFPVTLPPAVDASSSPTDFQHDLPLRVVSPICFEDTVPRLVRAMVYQPQSGEKRAELIANLTNDGWFAGTDQPWQHLQIAVYRSIELRVPTMRAVNMGVSGFVDSMGRIGPLAGRDGEHLNVQGVAMATVQTDPRATFYGQAGPWGSVIVAIVTGLLAAGGVYRRTRSR